MKKLLRRGLIAAAVVSTTGITLMPQEQNQSQRIPQFDNHEVKVWRTIVMPNGPLSMHRHEHARVIIPIVGGVMKIVQQSGASETHVWETGKAYWLTADPPNTMHADVNAGSKPIEVMVVELQRDK